MVINDAERLSKDAQHALRRTMEKYSSNIRFILCCSSVGRVISPIRSRCLLVRLSSPKDEEVTKISKFPKKKSYRIDFKPSL